MASHPRARLKIGVPGGPTATRLWLPFPRSLPAIAILWAFAFGMTVPLFVVADFTSLAAGETSSLFDFVNVAFSALWMLGWGLGVCLLVLLAATVTWGGETVVAVDGELRVLMGLRFIGLGYAVPLREPVSVSRQAAQAKSAHRWRGEHACISAAGAEWHIGSALDEAQFQHLREVITAAASAGGQGVAPRQPQAGDAAHAAAPGSLPRMPVPGTLALVLANLVPLGGVLLFDWSLGEIMLIYWAESGIIGLFNVAKMMLIGGVAGLFSGVFFVAHFGGFMVVHLLFIWSVFVQGQAGPSDQDVAAVLGMLLSLWPALLALLVSHAVSFAVNFVARGEYRRTTVGKQMKAPYGRIVVMHLTVLFGAFLSMAFGAELPVLILMIGLKVVSDLRAHRREHAAA